MKKNVIVVDDVRKLSDYDLSDLILTTIAEKTSYNYRDNYYPAFEAMSINLPYIGLHDIYYKCLRELFVLTTKIPEEKNKSYKTSVLSKYKKALKISKKVQKSKKNDMSIEGYRQSINQSNTIYLIAEDITLFDVLGEGDRRIKSAISYAKNSDKYEPPLDYGTTEITKKKHLKTKRYISISRG